MPEQTQDNQSAHTSRDKVAIVTGAARRIGATIVKQLHSSGYNVVIHYRHSSHDAQLLLSDLNTVRADSAIACRAELADDIQAASVVQATLDQWGRLDLLVNNASEFSPTPVGQIRTADLERLFSSNLHGPLFVAQEARGPLKTHRGCIINITDIYARIPHPDHTVYCASKAALSMMTQSLARELAPDVRVNAVAPGAILWPETTAQDADVTMNKLANDQAQEVPSGTEPGSLTEEQQAIIDKIPLRRRGDPQDIANAVQFLASEQAAYITGQILCVDGGRSL